MKLVNAFGGDFKCLVNSFGLMDARFTLQNVHFMQSQALVLWARLETCGDNFDPIPNDPKPLQVDNSFNEQFMALRKRHIKVLERKLMDMELRTKAQDVLLLVRKTLKKCINQKKSPAEVENGIPSEVTTV